MGGALALHVAYNINNNLAGVFTMSSFLNSDSMVYENLAKMSAKQLRKLPKLLMLHGELDEMVLHKDGQMAYHALTRLGVKADLISIPNLNHDVKYTQLITIKKWIIDLLPPLPTDLLNKL